MVIVCVGGQDILTLANTIANAALHANYNVVVSEVPRFSTKRWKHNSSC